VGGDLLMLSLPKTILQIKPRLFSEAFNMYGLYNYVQEYHFPVKCNLSNSSYDERCYFSECTQFDMFVGVSIIENHFLIFSLDVDQNINTAAIYQKSATRKRKIPPHCFPPVFFKSHPSNDFQ
jgi:hypothetical protein